MRSILHAIVPTIVLTEYEFYFLGTPHEFRNTKDGHWTTVGRGKVCKDGHLYLDEYDRPHIILTDNILLPVDGVDSDIPDSTAGLSSYTILIPGALDIEIVPIYETCCDFDCKITACAFIDDQREDVCENCRRCAICESYKKCNMAVRA